MIKDRTCAFAVVQKDSPEVLNACAKNVSLCVFFEPCDSFKGSSRCRAVTVPDGVRVDKVGPITVISGSDCSAVAEEADKVKPHFVVCIVPASDPVLDAAVKRIKKTGRNVTLICKDTSFSTCEALICERSEGFVECHNYPVNGPNSANTATSDAQAVMTPESVESGAVGEPEGPKTRKKRRRKKRS